MGINTIFKNVKSFSFGKTKDVLNHTEPLIIVKFPKSLNIPNFEVYYDENENLFYFINPRELKNKDKNKPKKIYIEHLEYIKEKRKNIDNLKGVVPIIDIISLHVYLHKNILENKKLKDKLPLVIDWLYLRDRLSYDSEEFRIIKDIIEKFVFSL